MKAIKIDFDLLNEHFHQIEFDRENSYLKSYATFINYFASLPNEIKFENLIIGSHFVYGWMPTILKLQISDEKSILEILNKAKVGTTLDVNEISALKACVNNSLVGASKLLHFINPLEYAIWDSRINKYLTGRNHYGIDNVETYIDYLRELKVVEENPQFKELHNSVNQALQYKVSPKRAIELIMFEGYKFLPLRKDRFNRYLKEKK